MPSYVVTGAARGLGLEFVKQISEKPDNVVFALVRSKKTAEKLDALARANSNIHVLEADITDVKALKLAAKEVSDVTGGTLDVLINNAAFVDDERNHLTLDGYPEGREDLLEEDFRKTFDVNVLGVIHTTNVFLPLLRSTSQSQSELKKVITLSTGLASIPFTLGTHLAAAAPYSVSKAALNMVVAKYAAKYTLRANGSGDGGGDGEKEAKIVFLALSPGLVKTKEALDGPSEQLRALVTSFRRLYPDFIGPITPEESVRSLFKVIDNATMEDSGSFLSHKGNEEWL